MHNLRGISKNLTANDLLIKLNYLFILYFLFSFKIFLTGQLCLAKSVKPKISIRDLIFNQQAIKI